MPSFISVSFGAPYVHYANNNAGDTYDSNLTAIFTGFAANANIQISSTEYTNQEDFYDVSTTYEAPNTIVTVNRIFDDYYQNYANLSTPCVWTFTDLNNVANNVATATFALPMSTITGNIIYQSYNINDLNEYIIYNYCNFLQLGNSCTVNLQTLYPYETVTFTGGFANGTFRNPTYSTLGTISADANGIVAYTFSVQQNSNAFYLAVSSNTVNYTYGGIIFDQSEIISANSTTITGYAWTPYDYQNTNTGIIANVSIYVDGFLIGNTTTNVYGQWSFPVALSDGTYAITAQAIPQNPSAILSAASIPYSNASMTAVIATLENSLDYFVTQSALSVLWQPTPTIQFDRVSQASLSVLELLSNGETNHDRVSQVNLGVLIQEQSPNIYPNHVKATQESLSVLLGPNTHHTRCSQSGLSVLVQEVKPTQYFHTRTSQASLNVLVSHSAKRGKRSTIVIT